MKSLTLFNTQVRVADDNMISLTDMWKAAKAVDRNVDNLRPTDFLRSSVIKLFINALIKGGIFTPFTIIKGRNGGTFATRYNVISIPCFLPLYFKSIYTAYAIGCECHAHLKCRW